MASRRQGGLMGISEELLGRISDLPGAKSLLDGVNTLKERVDELKRLRDARDQALPGRSAVRRHALHTARVGAQAGFLALVRGEANGLATVARNGAETQRRDRRLESVFVVS